MASHDTKGRAERRSAPRVSGQVRFSAGRVEGTGFIHTISLGGARIATSAPPPPPGTAVVLFFCLGEDGEVIEVRGEAVRDYPDGFAVRFVRLDPRMQDLLTAALRPTGALSEES